MVRIPPAPRARPRPPLAIALLVIAVLALAGFVVAAPRDDRRADPAVPIRVRAVDAATGAPVAGVRVTVRTPGTARDRDGDDGDSALTAADGRADLRPAAAHPVELLRFGRDGYVPTVAEWSWDGRADRSPADLAGATFDVPIEPGEPFGTRVVGPDGRPVAGAAVRVTFGIDLRRLETDDGWPNVFPDADGLTLTTGDDGRWQTDRMPAAAGTRTRFEVTHDDLAGTTVNDDGDLQLGVGVRLAGRVVGADGRPVAGATVSTATDHYLRSPSWPCATTGPDGRFRLAAMVPGVRPVVVQAAGHGPRLLDVDFRPGATLEVALAPPATLAGRVVGDDGPIAEARVFAPEWRGLRVLDRAATTDHEGRFEVADLPADPLTFIVSADGYVGSRQVTLDPREATTVPLRPTPVVRGTVVDARTGRPVERFRLIRGHADTGRPGSPPPSFDYAARPVVLGGGAFEREIDLSFTDSEVAHARVQADGYAPADSGPLRGRGPHDVRFDLTPAPDTAGVVIDVDGSPAAGAVVHLLPAGSSMTMLGGQVLTEVGPIAVADAAGRFSMPPQVPGPFALLAVGPDGWASVGADPSRFAAGAAPLVVRLRPWARLGGSWPEALAGSRPLRVTMGTAMSTATDPAGGDAEFPPLVRWVWTAVVDGEGRFAVERVPDFGGEPFALSLDPDGEGESDAVEVRVPLASGEMSVVIPATGETWVVAADPAGPAGPAGDGPTGR